jgi:hypothetical protein
MYKVEIGGSTEGNERSPRHLENYLQKKHISEMVVKATTRGHNNN